MWDAKIATCAGFWRFDTLRVVSTTLFKFCSCSTEHGDTCCVDFEGHAQDAQKDWTRHMSSGACCVTSWERDLALKHVAGSEADYVFTEKTHRNVHPTFDVGSVAVHIDKDGDQSQRVLGNADVDLIRPCSPQRSTRSKFFKNQICLWD